MPRPRSKPTNQYLQHLIQERGYRTLKDAAAAVGIPYHTILGYADQSGSNPMLRSAVKMADAFEVPLDEFIRGLLGEIQEQIYDDIESA